MSEEGQDLEAILGRMMARVQVTSDSPESPCPALRPDEEECRGGRHTLKADVEWQATFRDANEGREMRVRFAGAPASRMCPMRFYHDERRRLSAQLSACGIPASQDMSAGGISQALLRGIDQHRAVIGLRDALQATKQIRDAGWPSCGHFAIIGTVGTAKTHLLLALYFSALEAGISSWWLTSGDLRQVAKDQASYDDADQDKARTRLSSWQHRKLLVIDDLGDRLSDQRSQDPGTSQVSALLLDLLNGTTARIFWSSNLAEAGLRKHPDIGPRAVSRLFADHSGTACRVVALGGEDQRLHGLRSTP